MVRKAPLFVIIIIFLSACNHQDTSEPPDTQEVIKHEKAREIVWDYIVAQGLDETGFYKQEAWDHASVEKDNFSNKYKRYLVEKNYNGKIIYLVSNKEAISTPIFIVDQEIKKVIGVKEGS